MAPPTRTIYIMLVVLTGLLYFLYAAYTSTFDGQLYHLSAWKNGNFSYSLSSPKSHKKERHNSNSLYLNSTSISNSNVTKSKSDDNGKSSSDDGAKGNSNANNVVPQGNTTKPSRQEEKQSEPEKQSVIQRIPPKQDNSTVDYIVQGVITKNVYDSGFMIPNVELCPDLGKNLELVIIITTAPKHSEARMAIRQTWGHFQQRSDVAIGFMLGRTVDGGQAALVQEAALYRDMIQGNFVDSYNNLTLKTIAMLEWVDDYCNQVKFVLKTDDDMFINIPKLLTFLSKHSKDKRKIFGRLAKKWKPIRNKSSKYYVSVQQYRQPLFPDFTTGPAYVMTSDIIHDLHTTALEKTYLKLEDVYTTGIVAQENKIQRVHINEFLNRRVTLNPCNVQKGISIHMVKTYEQYDLWKKLLDGRSKC